MQIRATDSEQPADWATARPLINDALSALSERDREAVLLRYFEGHG
jgi:DNA-directed RNA polymerase specialized sigma24 family protein